MCAQKCRKYYKNTGNKSVELIGMPAVGKTTFVNKVLEQRADIVFGNSFISNKRIVRTGQRIGAVIYKVMSDRKSFIRIYKIVKDTQQKSVKDFWNVFSYFLLICDVSRKQTKEKSVIWDQGIIQAIWSIGFSGNSQINLDMLLEVVELPEEIVYLYEPRTILIERDKNRERKVRLDYSDLKEIEKGEKIFQQITEYLIRKGYEINE